MNLLGQYINLLGLIIAKTKVAAVKTIEYPAMFGDLKHFLGLIKYLKSSIHYYAQVAQPPQDLKTTLLKPGPVARTQQKVFASRIKVPQFTDIELVLFTTLKE